MTVNEFVAIIALVVSLNLAYDAGAARKNGEKWVALTFRCVIFGLLSILGFVGS